MPQVQATTAPWDAPLAEFWEHPNDPRDHDLYYGPWGRPHAPDPETVYTFLRSKSDGVRRGVLLRDGNGRQWHVTQQSREPGETTDADGSVDVVLSRVLSALGYHQAPIYYLPTFKMSDSSGVTRQAGGRFRLSTAQLEDRGNWAWEHNPFVDTKPHQGLLVLMLMFDSSDLTD